MCLFVFLLSAHPNFKQVGLLFFFKVTFNFNEIFTTIAQNEWEWDQLQLTLLIN
jgi:hypothetical protein